jgi:hypothetical protein
MKTKLIAIYHLLSDNFRDTAFTCQGRMNGGANCTAGAVSR